MLPGPTNVVLAGRATTVPFTAVLTGPERTITGNATAASTCAILCRRRWRSGPIWLCKQGVDGRGASALPCPTGRSGRSRTSANRCSTVKNPQVTAHSHLRRGQVDRGGGDSESTSRAGVLGRVRVGSIACGVILVSHAVRRWAGVRPGPPGPDRQWRRGDGPVGWDPKAALPTAEISGEALRRSWRSTARHEPGSRWPGCSGRAVLEADMKEILLLRQRGTTRDAVETGGADRQSRRG
jgi:hypothetical protein